jgi:hypothetical protein
MTMTTVRSIASARGMSTLDINAVADDACVALGTIVRDLNRARCNPTHPVFGAIDALVALFGNMTANDVQPEDKADAPTFTVAYTPDGKDTPIAPPTTFGNKVDDAPPANDITARRNDFLVELASRKRMTKKEARAFIGDGGKDILAGLVGDGSILETARGRSAGYRMPEKTTTIVDPAPTMPVPAPVIVATLTAPTSDSAEEVPAGFDNADPAPAPADDKATPAPKKPRKPKSAPKDESPITNASDDDKREFVTAIIDMAKQKGITPTKDDTKPSADAIGAAFLILGKRVSSLDTVKAKKAVKLMTELRGLLS